MAREARLPSHPPSASTPTPLAAATAADAEQAWDRLRLAVGEQPLHATGVQAAFESYLRLALTDDSWLLRQAPPLPGEVLVDQGLPARLRGPLARLAQRLTHNLPADEDLAGVVRRGVLMLRAVDFADRIALLVGGPDLVEVGIGRLASRAAEVLVDDAAGVRVAEIVGPLDGAALARWIVPPLSRADEPWLTCGNPIGERLPTPVIALLAGAVDPGALITSTNADPLAVGPVALEVAVSSASGRFVGDPRLRGPAVEYLLHQAARDQPDADPGPIVAEAFDRLAGDEPWTVEALLRLVERAPPMLGAELVPIVLRHLPDWADDPLSARLSAALLKRIQFLPQLGADRRVRPRLAGTTDGQAQMLNLLAASGVGWLQMDDGLHRRAAEILMWGDRAWADADEEVRRLIAPRITVAAFQVALAAEPAQATTVLRARLGVIPVGSGWRSAVAIGLEPALPMVAQVLRLNRYRLAGELVIASTRAMLQAQDQTQFQPDRPRLPMLPVGPVIRWLVEHEDRPELKEHLAALVEQELRDHRGPVDRPGLLAFWERAALVVSSPNGLHLPEPVLEEVLQVALGYRVRAGRPIHADGLAGLLATGLPADRARPRWWRRWGARS